MSKAGDFKQLMALPSSRTTSHAYLKKADFDSLVAQAAPLYKERLSSDPFYKARLHDDLFWTRFVSSRVREARALVEASTDGLRLTRAVRQAGRQR